MDVKTLYAARDHMAQGEHYLRHVDAMTGEGLHAKSAIAAELAHRDIVIERQAAELEALRAERDALARALNTAEANLRYWRESRGAFTPSDTELSDTLRRIDAARTGGGAQHWACTLCWGSGTQPDGTPCPYAADHAARTEGGK